MVASAAGIALVVLIGSVPHAWSLAAAAVLVYYALTNLSAMRVAEGRFIARWVHTVGLAGCVSLAVFVEPIVLGVMLALVALGFGVRWLSRRLQPPPVGSSTGPGSSTGSLPASSP